MKDTMLSADELEPTWTTSTPPFVRAANAKSRALPRRWGLDAVVR